MKVALTLFPLLIATSALTSVTLADEVDLSAIRDNVIYEDNVDNSNGSGDFLFAGRNGGGSIRRSLLLFDPAAALPTNAIVDQVTLSLFVSQTGAGDFDVSLHRLESDWGEGASDAPGGEGGGTAAMAGDSTWTNRFFPGDPWASSGGDFDPIASATTTVGGVGMYSWTSAGLVDDVQSWLDGDQANFGWALIGDESEFPTTKRFNSRSNSQNTPVLTVTFSVVPEPASAVIMLLAPALLLRRSHTSR